MKNNSITLEVNKIQLEKLEIPIKNVFYDKDSKTLSIQILDFTFVGHYKKSTVLEEVIKDIYKSLEKKIAKENILILNENKQPIDKSTRLKEISLAESKIEEIEEGEVKVSKSMSTQVKAKRKMGVKPSKKAKRSISSEESLISDDELVSNLRSPKPSYPSSPPPGGKSESDAESSVELEDIVSSTKEGVMKLKEDFSDEEEPSEVEAKTRRYDIKMGLQYYPIMMERRSYLFYVYFSHKELIIEDEKGKTVYKTEFTITTTERKPPILDLRIEGEGFEVHPYSGKVQVKKKFVNPPVMIFSILPVKLKKKHLKKDKKEGEKRYLNIYIEYKDETVSHTILSITVLPKFYRLDLGPISFNLSKAQALMISVISLLITAVSAIYSVLTIEPSSTLVDILGGSIPGIGSLIFIVTFLFTLLKKGVFPIKEQVSGLLNLEKGTGMIK